MKTKLMVTAAASVLLFGSAAFAHSAAPSASGGASSSAGSAAAQTDFTDDQLKSFAEVTLDLQRQQSQGATLDPAATTAAVERSGLTVDQYNQIATRMRTDQAFNARVQQLAQASAGQSSRGGASSSSQSTESMTAAPGSSPSAGSMGRDAGDSTAPPAGSGAP